MADQGPTEKRPLQLRILFMLIRSVGVLSPRIAAIIARALFRDPRNDPTKPWELLVEEAAVRGQTAGGISYLHFRPEQVRLRLVTVHGWEGRSTQFGPLAQFLLPLGIETVAIDGPAHGQSPGRQADPLLFSDAVLEVAAEIGPFDAVMGHSMGAGSMVISMARGLAAKKAVYIAGPAAFQEVLQRFADLFGMNPRTRTKFFALIEKASGRRFEGNDLEDLVKRLTVDALIVHDTKDDDVPYSDAERLHAAWPHSTLLTSEGLGHKYILRDPRTMQAIADFLLK
jgi:pimeloyl-ACP methyl ester carboxylesterase